MANSFLSNACETGSPGAALALNEKVAGAAIPGDDRAPAKEFEDSVGFLCAEEDSFETKLWLAG